MLVYSQHVMSLGEGRLNCSLHELAQGLKRQDQSYNPAIINSEISEASHFFHSEKVSISLGLREIGQEATLELNSDLIGVIEIQHRFEALTSEADIIQHIEDMREKITLWFKNSELFAFLLSHVAPLVEMQSDNGAQPHLLYGYSQILIENPPTPNTGRKTVAEEIEIDASFIRVSKLPDALKANILSVFRGVTIHMAMLYELQERSVEQSREIFYCDTDSPASDTKVMQVGRWLDWSTLISVELAQEDYMASSLEEQYGKPVYEAWGLSSLFEKVQLSQNHLKERLGQKYVELEARGQRRTNKLLLVFTLISLIGITSGLVSMYDFANAYSPAMRVLLVVAVFVLGCLATAIYLRPKSR